MKEQKVKHSNPNGKKKKNAGFYIALAICIVAIGGAAWTTYSSVLDYQTPKEESSDSSSARSEQEAGRTVSGIEYSKAESSSEASEKTANTLPESSGEESSEKTDVSEVSEVSVVTEESSAESSREQSETVKPLDGKVIKGFSAENPVYSKTMGDWRVHEGIDIAAEDGERVRSYADGIVKEIYNDELFGYTIKIEHTTGIDMLYCGLSPTTIVKVGDSVSAGDYIGAVFTIPSEIMDETHLHLVAVKDGATVDPQAVLNQQS